MTSPTSSSPESMEERLRLLAERVTRLEQENERLRAQVWDLAARGHGQQGYQVIPPPYPVSPSAAPYQPPYRVWCESPLTFNGTPVALPG